VGHLRALYREDGTGWHACDIICRIQMI
jgi:hypothetical protein